MGSLNFEADDEEIAAKMRAEVVAWLNSLFPELKLPEEATEWELRVQLFDGSVLNGILRMLNAGAVDEIRYADYVPSERRPEILKLFLSVVNNLGLPSFQVSDLEKGNFSAVLECLLAIRSHIDSTVRKDKVLSPLTRCKSLQIRKWKHRESLDGLLTDGIHGGQSSPVFGDDKKSSFAERKFQHASRSLVSPDTTSPLSQYAGNKLHEVFQLKRGQFSELPSAKISEILKLNTLDIAPTQLLLSVANEMLDESIEKKNGELHQRVACLLKKVLQEIERRVTTQAGHIIHQSNMMKAREEKYLSRIKVLETLAKGTNEETRITANQVQLLQAGTTLFGSLHLIDLAGSERVERSEVTGDRLKETQHINKSLSALGDVIFALSQKSVHIPYRNSKLTQVLQSSLGGHAKTLMFVQINPDVKSYSESLSALKFAERVSGVELGAACSNKESKDVKNLTEQVALLKEANARKDKEIEKLQMLRETGTFSSGVNHVKHGNFVLRHSSFSPEMSSKDLTSQQGLGLSVQRIVRSNNEASLDSDNSDNSDRHSEISSQHSVDDKHKRESLCHSKHSGEEPGLSCPADFQIVAVNGVDSEEGLSDAYNGCLLETSGLVSAIEFSHLPEQNRLINGNGTKEKMSRVKSSVAKPLQPKIAQETVIHSKLKDSLKSPTSLATKGALKPINSKDGLKSPSLKSNTNSQATLSSAKPLSKRWQ
ncbi:Kinesin-4 [Dendrobium catenatum]|uniref:Kinesin-like protein n=1 Tax=Dendrobium catenatum TaxID=906689 RepID=A0A2I0WGY1_9ASPA|nr:Kinesin-4 [Dendrobium catenatum]